eukprot:CAMPEP_0194265428 /NCGR_PEP_ID=MMETSP0169-20130528/677_1 /TAXON_ID=218684 /ORGANISM="Corethron pennatum, Strain L29A3" /LENGTH=191 /DNA_ID=CAMNT_0039005893 /DNA_START=46 /DNA_END=621 /DNA_ORIENTATION=-
MRPLTEDETRILFLKLAEYIGRDVEALISAKRGNAGDNSGRHVFRLHRDRVYYSSESVMRTSAGVSREELLSLGTCFGKFSKSGKKFRLHITALDHISQYAKHKVWVKPSAEMSFLYGNNVTKSGLARITENTPQYGGVVVYGTANGTDLPLGFGVAAQGTERCRELDAGSNVVLHQADIGEYLRVEDDMF